jgi:hypothetical protein
MKKATKALALAGGIIISSFGGTADAAITFTETTDMSGNLGSPYILGELLGLGTNTITGSLPNSFTLVDCDVFHVNNPGGLVVTSITVTITDFVGTTASPANGTGDLRLEDPGFDVQRTLGNGQYSLVPSSSDAPVFEFRFFGPQDSLNNEIGSMNYVVTINAIPEPSAPALVLGALGLGVVRRQRKA